MLKYADNIITAVLIFIVFFTFTLCTSVFFSLLILYLKKNECITTVLNRIYVYEYFTKKYIEILTKRLILHAEYSTVVLRF